MTKELRDQWVAALRSGKYEQGFHAMRKKHKDGTETFCCLGVLCDIVEPKKWRHKKGEIRYTHNKADVYPTAELLDRIGLDPGDVNRLAGMNDNGVPFAEIADKIEAEGV